MTTTNPSEIWSSALGSLQLEVTRHNYDTWLRGTTGVSAADGTFVVGVPSAFVAETLEKRMSPLISRTLHGLLNDDVRVVYRVHTGGDTGGDTAGDTSTAAPGPAAAPALKKRAAPPDAASLTINPRLTFDTFVVGKSNRFAHAVAMAAAENPGRSDLNPLYLHAGVGLGKTHLLHAIGNAVRARGLSCLYVSAEQFTNDFISALREGRQEEFRAKYRNLDVLLVDDIQFIAGKEHSRESFFHTFNDLHTSSKQIVISSDSHPKSIPLLEDRLRSRFEAGVRADIQPPDLETRMAILGKKAQLARVKLEPDVLDFLARKVVRNVRELEGALNRLIAMASMTGRPPDLDLAQQAVADMPTPAGRLRRSDPAEIIAIVSTYFAITPQELVAKTRKSNVALARQVAAYLLREQTTRTLAEIGGLLGDRGHSTILRAHDKIAREINLNTERNRQLGEIRAALDRSSPH
ncbi:MAG: chromosomal replication initiator protein DnaA [Dehalococcoidia bacterium]|nr:chromosomal replication initiator protein DnaA [Dehalococcoidia bacterium]